MMLTRFWDSLKDPYFWGAMAVLMFCIAPLMVLLIAMMDYIL